MYAFCLRLCASLILFPLLQVSTLAEKLRQPPHSLSTVVLSIDDLYLPHNLQSELAATHPTNPLIQHRGQPSTHDLPLAVSLFSDLRNGNQTRIPSYDKSAFNGQGDRTPIEKWSTVNEQGDSNIKIVIFEGWCVGFRAMPEFKLKIQWEDAIKQRENAEYQGRLGYNKLEDVEYVNEALKDYDQLTNELDALIHIDATDEHFVYSWRLQQEAVLRKTRGAGMTDEQVINFVDGCMLNLTDHLVPD